MEVMILDTLNLSNYLSSQLMTECSRLERSLESKKKLLPIWPVICSYCFKTFRCKNGVYSGIFGSYGYKNFGKSPE